MGPKQNSKAVAANAKQEQLQAERDRKEAEKLAKEEDAEWSKGARVIKENDNGAAKASKKAEMAALLAEEEAQLASSNVKVTAKVTKSKKGDDLSVLNAALASAPKTKAQKLAEEKKKADEKKKAEEKVKEEKRKEEREKQKAADELRRKQAEARGIVLDHGDSLMVKIVNKLDDDEANVTGIEAALGALSADDGAVDNHPEKRQKALYNAYFEKMLPVMKEEHKGLKLSQYKERIFEMWKTAPENPRNGSA